MPHQPLALKYRPAFFRDIVGQEVVSKALANSVILDRLYHAFLFHGSRGSGKTSMARIFARALNCANRDNLTKEGSGEPCGNCKSCAEIAEGRSLDVLEMDAASHTQVDHIREVILDTVGLVPARDRYRIFIIDEVHMLSTASFNAVLKTLEEPPPHILFILATTEFSKVPATVVSRTQSFLFRSFSSEEIANRLEFIVEREKISITEDALRAVARSAQGSLRDALSILEQLVSLVGREAGGIKKEDLIRLLGFVEEGAVEDLIDALVVSPSFEKAKAVVSRQLINLGHSPAQLLVSLFRGVSDRLCQALESPQTALYAHRLHQLAGHINKLEGELRFASDPLGTCEIGLLGYLLENYPQLVCSGPQKSQLKPFPNQDDANEEIQSQPAKAVENKLPLPGTEETEAVSVSANEPEEPKTPEDETPPAVESLPEAGNMAPIDNIGVAQNNNQPVDERYGRFLSLLKEASLDLYLEGAKLEKDASAQGAYELKAANAFYLDGLEKNRAKILPAWKKVFGSAGLKFGKLAEAETPPTPSPATAEVPEDIEKIAKIFGGKVRKIRRQ